jgi:phospholipid/cholesterol/gamma-HCH transport system substrate-binding protein
MPRKHTVENGTYLWIVLGFVELLILWAQLPSTPVLLPFTHHGYRVISEFDDVGDLRSGAPVTLAGVRIGEIEGPPRLDPANNRAIATLYIDRRSMRIPADSDVSIERQGLLGGEYVAVDPGASRSYLRNGSHLRRTRSAINLEDLVAKAFTSAVA